MLCLKLSDLYLIVMTCFFLYANLVKQSKSTIFICNVTALIFIGCCYKYHPFICRHILYHANQFSSKIVRTNGFNGSSLVEEVHSIIYCSSKDLKSYFVRRNTCPNFKSYRIKIEDDSNFIDSMLHWIDPFSSTQRR